MRANPFCLLDINLTPPGGFTYTQPETGYTITSIAYRDALDKIIAHRKSNNIPIGGQFEVEIQDAICEKIPEQFCAECFKEFGVGDAVEFIAKPIAKFIYTVTNGSIDVRNCQGCKKRKEWLNENLPTIKV